MNYILQKIITIKALSGIKKTPYRLTGKTVLNK